MDIQKSLIPAREYIPNRVGNAFDLAQLLGLAVASDNTVPGLIRSVDRLSRSPLPPTVNDRHLLMAAAQRMYIGRRARSRHLPGFILGEPSWDMLLALYATGGGGPRHTISGITDLAACPPTTALRHLAALENNGLVDRWPNPRDRRVSFVTLSESGWRAMDFILTEVIKLGSP